MRLFIAVPVPEGVRKAAGEIIRRLRASGADFKWVEPENLHLTLAFLGEISKDKIPILEEALGEAASGRGPFELVFGELGAFDSLDHPRVIWLGVTAGASALEELAAALKAALDRRGLLPEKEKGRAFQAHLTLGRMRGARNLGTLRGPLKATPVLEGLESRAERLVLYESRLSPKGPAYSALREACLRG